LKQAIFTTIIGFSIMIYIAKKTLPKRLLALWIILSL